MAFSANLLRLDGTRSMPKAWATIMHASATNTWRRVRLGQCRFGADGFAAPAGCSGITPTWRRRFRPMFGQALSAGGPQPAGLSPDEKLCVDGSLIL